MQVTAEEHNIVGGLGCGLQVAAKHSQFRLNMLEPGHFRRKRNTKFAGKYGLTTEHIVAAAESDTRKKS
jgi:transketolase C-terminal domain/subunit